jgi:hypothetical protein
MSKRCKHIKQNGFNCGSHAFNLYMDDIDQDDLCDVHYWQAKAQRTWVELTDEDIKLVRQTFPLGVVEDLHLFARAVLAKLKEKNND